MSGRDQLKKQRSAPHASEAEAAARRRIGRDLRLLYAAILDQPLPERFTQLVEALAAGDRTSEGSR